MTYIGSKLWTNIDANIKGLTRLKNFKNALKPWLENVPNVIDKYF